MFGWLRNLFGSKVQLTGEPLVLTEEQKVTDNAALAETVVVEEAPKPKKATAPKPKKATKAKATEDLSSMNKTQLLALCKERGVAANASLKKAEILQRLA